MLLVEISGSWGYDGRTLKECFFNGCRALIFAKLTNDNIEVKDQNGDTIHLMKGGSMTGMAMVRICN